VVELRLVTEIDSTDDADARYLPNPGLIEIAIPTSPRRFRDSLVHELAHHLDATCASRDSLRQEWAAARGQDVAAWATGPWEGRSAELFAETVVELTLGERVRFGRSVELPVYATDVVGGWLASD